MLAVGKEPATKAGSYTKAQYFLNDTPARVAWWLHIALSDGIYLDGICEDGGRCFDLYSNDIEYELSYNNKSWTNGPFPFDVFKIHGRKNPRKYANTGLNSYYVQFRKDFVLAQLCPAEMVRIEGLDGSIMAPASSTTSVTVHPVASQLALGLHSLLGRFLGE